MQPPPPVHRTPQEQALEQALSRFHGAPYRAGGADPSGVDCSGLIQAAFQQAGVNLSRTVAQQYGQGQPVARQDLRFGDVIFFNRFCQTKARNYYLAGMAPQGYLEEACHNGIYLGQGRFIHASPKGVFISRLDAQVWSASFLGARRYLPQGPPEGR
jgi:cell wall-associated NlpC family hydrolase